VKSGIDWFELHGEVQYGDTTANLPELLAAVRRGDSMVVLGMAPSACCGGVAEALRAARRDGEKGADHLKFRANQAALLDALLAAQPEVDFDETFERVRQRVRSFHGVETTCSRRDSWGNCGNTSATAWLDAVPAGVRFRRLPGGRHGVGKTAQVLATLEMRRLRARAVAGGGSQVGDVQLAAGIGALHPAAAGAGTPWHGARHQRDSRHDLVLTTYGTMLRDAPVLARIEFDYLVLTKRRR